MSALHVSQTPLSDLIAIRCSLHALVAVLDGSGSYGTLDFHGYLTDCKGRSGFGGADWA